VLDLLVGWIGSGLGLLLGALVDFVRFLAGAWTVEVHGGG